MACYLSSNATYRSTLQLKFTSGPNHFEEEYAHYEANPDHLKRIRIQLIYVTLFYFNKTINVIFIKSYWRNHSGSGKNILDFGKNIRDPEKTFLIRKKHSWSGKKHSWFGKKHSGSGKNWCCGAELFWLQPWAENVCIGSGSDCYAQIMGILKWFIFFILLSVFTTF